jgi:hypothetical protein
MDQMDVVRAMLYGSLKKVINIMQPIGFARKSKEH